jgi:acetyltransferase-like isoleucine patch superfamily enzyme
MKLKKIVSKIIMYLPTSSLRVFCYKKMFGYQIGKNVKIGKSYINCNKLILEDNVIIGSKNVISCNEFSIGKNSKIFSHNIITGLSNFYLGKDSRIIDHHFFDLWNPIKIGDSTWIAGRNSQFWTHGSLKTKLNEDLSIVIGNDVYVGSGVKFSPGVKIASNNLVGLGSTVSGVFSEENSIIASNKSVVIKSNVNWKQNW